MGKSVCFLLKGGQYDDFEYIFAKKFSFKDFGFILALLWALSILGCEMLRNKPHKIYNRDDHFSNK